MIEKSKIINNVDSIIRHRSAKRYIKESSCALKETIVKQLKDLY